MPLHEFVCKVCSKEFEALIFHNEEVQCPQCSSLNLEQKWSLPAAPLSGATKMQGYCSPGCCKMPGMPPCAN